MDFAESARKESEYTRTENGAVALNTTSDASGISTTTLKIASVMPVVRPKPGMTLLFVLFISRAKYRTRHSLCPILNKYHVL